MRNLLLSVIIFLLAYSNATSQERLLVMEGCSMHSKILDKELKYSVCLPEEYYENPKKAYPVTYLLHGYGDDHSGWLEYGAADVVLKRNIYNSNALPMILIMPDAFNTYYVNDYAGTFMYENMFINELVPYIDSVFRTIKDSQHRALAGYSMGGFGAMMLHLKHPDIFGCTVPLSMSVRTDEQYMTEDASGWDNQWGRLFGEPGLKGNDRITAYYKKNSPFHVLQSLSSAEKSRLKIYMINGDDEGTLCRSNEELHILMQTIGVPHEYRVVNGGHSFRVWRDAMPYALRFISEFFNGTDYAGDQVVKGTTEAGGDVRNASGSTNTLSAINLNALKLPAIQTGKPFEGGINEIFVPQDYNVSNRMYPIIVVMGDFDKDQRTRLAQQVYNHRQVIDNCPVILAFITAESTDNLVKVFNNLESLVRIRSGKKYRSLISFKGNGYNILEMVSKDFPVNVAVLSDNRLTRKEAETFVSASDKEILNRTRIFIDTPDKGSFAEGNGALHMLLRDMEHNHEYRLRESSKNLPGLKFNDFEWLMNGLNEPIDYIILNFHR